MEPDIHYRIQRAHHLSLSWASCMEQYFKLF
jgi:hypothetical protein